MNEGRSRAPTNLPEEVELTLNQLQPLLSVVVGDDKIEISGYLQLADHSGVFDQYQIRIELPFGFPEDPPVVRETEGRIEWNADRHVDSDGACCLAVWEEWLLTSPDTSFKGFVEGPLREFFVNQTIYDLKEVWPGPARPHGIAGVIEAYSEILGIQPEKGLIKSYLMALKEFELKKNRSCPCGSKLRLGACHRKEVLEMRRRIPPKIARKMLARLDSQYAS